MPPLTTDNIPKGWPKVSNSWTGCGELLHNFIVFKWSQSSLNYRKSGLVLERCQAEASAKKRQANMTWIRVHQSSIDPKSSKKLTIIHSLFTGERGAGTKEGRVDTDFGSNLPTSWPGLSQARGGPWKARWGHCLDDFQRRYDGGSISTICSRNRRCLAVGRPCWGRFWRPRPSLDYLDYLDQLDHGPTEEGEHWHQQEPAGA